MVRTADQRSRGTRPGITRSQAVLWRVKSGRACSTGEPAEQARCADHRVGHPMARVTCCAMVWTCGGSMTDRWSPSTGTISRV